MKPLLSTIDLVAVVSPAFAKEGHVRLDDYAEKAQIICVCTVTKSHDDGSVTAKVERNLKGEPAMLIRIRGETGFCVTRGPVAWFMTSNRRYLVFLFDDNKVGRLGGVVEIDKEGSLLIRHMDGFSDSVYAKEVSAHKLPLENAVGQIQAIVKK